MVIVGNKDATSALLCARPFSVSAIEAQLAAIVASPPFLRAPRMRRLLTYLVREALAGRGMELKEYTIAIHVFDKPEDFDPATSAVIRVEVGRLRRLLAQYQQEHSDGDALEIFVPKGSYVPRIEARDHRPHGSQRSQASFYDANIRAAGSGPGGQGMDDRLFGLIADIEGKCVEALLSTAPRQGKALAPGRRASFRASDAPMAASRPYRPASGHRDLADAIHHLRMALETLVALRERESDYGGSPTPFPKGPSAVRPDATASGSRS